MRYTQSMIEIVRSMYSDHRAKEIAQLLGVSMVVVYRIAVKHGIKKPKTWRTDPRSGVFQKGVRQSPGTEFKKGQRAHNKGMKVEPHVYDKMSRTFFPKGHKPFNYKPIGTITIRRDSTGIPYQFIKITENYWELLHRKIWMDAHGSIPRHLIVTFKDGNSMNCNLDNLKLISKRENLQRNSIANIPEHLREVVKLKNKLTKKIQEHGKKQVK